MNSTEIKAYKLRIEKSSGQSINDIINEIVSQKEFPIELVASVIEALNKGQVILSDLIYEIIILTKCKDLYQLAESKNILSEWDYIHLFKSGYLEDGIEIKVCDLLYNCYEDNANPQRRAILEAMKKYGTKQSFDILEVIEYELEPSAIISKIEQGTLSKSEFIIKENIERKSQISFFDLVKIVKSKVYKRINTSKPHNPEFDLTKKNGVTFFDNTEESYIEKRLDILQKRAFDYLGNDPESAMNQARKAAEAICKDIYTKEKIGNKPANRQELNELITSLNQKKILPRQVYIHLANIRDLGNFGSHDQGEESKDITMRTAIPCIESLKNVIAWYKDNFLNLKDNNNI